MFRSALCVGTALACWAAAAGFNPVRAQAPPPPPRQERQQERQERRDERRGQVPVAQPPATTAPVPGQTQAQYQANYQDNRGARTPQTYRVKDVLGTKVSIEGGLSIGTVDDIIFDDDGYVDYVIVMNEGKYVVVPWQAAKFNFSQKAATVSITQQQFQQVPTYTAQQLPTINYFEPAWQQRIYGYYGLTRGQERRIERRDNRRGP